MPQLDAARLRRWADEMDAEERGERETALEEKVDRLEAQLANGGLSDDDRRLLTEAQARLAALEAVGTTEPAAAAETDEEEGTVEETAEEETTRRTRPGRKSGAAYDWTVDEDGNVQRSDVAVVYTGADEPDEVELPE